jgi:AAA-like domain/TIR domain
MAKSKFLWDVFVSHSSAQKPLVRAIVQQWRQLGLRVFYDEDTIQPGEDVVTALDRACENSRHTVLFITPESIASKWVDQELKRAVYVDPAAMERRLIPVLLEPLEASEIPLSVRMLSRTDLTDPETRRQQYHHLLASLKITAHPLPDFPILETAAKAHAAPLLERPVLESGALPTDSPSYIERKVERKIHEVLKDTGATVTIKGHGKSGKSSLLARLCSRAIENGRACCILDFYGLDAKTFKTSDELFPALAQSIADELDLDLDPAAQWSARRGVKQNLTIFLEKQVLARLECPLLLAFDNADLIFRYQESREALVSTLRVWHNLRADTRKGKMWKSVGLVVTHSSEPGLWIDNPYESPFNVAHEFILDDFTEEEVVRLGTAYGRELRGKADALIDLVGGHPYLVRLALYTMATERCTFAALEKTAIDDDGPFAPYLGHLFNILHSDNLLLKAVRQILKYGKCDDDILFQRLWSAGFTRGEDRRNVRLRYDLFDRYFRKKLL